MKIIKKKLWSIIEFDFEISDLQYLRHLLKEDFNLKLFEEIGIKKKTKK